MKNVHLKIYILLFLSLQLFSATLGDAHRIYSANKAALTDGVTNIENLLFVKVSQDVGKYYKSHIVEGRAMLATQRYLVDFYQPQPDFSIDFSFDKTSGLYKRLMGSFKRSYNFTFKSQSRVLFNSRQGDKHVYISVLPYDHALKKSAPYPVKITYSEWLNALKKYYNALKYEDDEAKLSDFYEELGAIEDVLFYTAEDLSYTIPLTNFPFALVVPSQNVAIKDQTAEQEPFTISNEAEAISHLKNQNGLVEAFDFLYQSMYDQKQYAKALYLSLISHKSVDQLSEKFGNVKRCIDMISQKTGAWSEYSQFISLINNEVRTHKNILCDQQKCQEYSLFHVLNSVGHIQFSYEKAKKVNSEFREAEELFNRGVNINKIIELLNHSITKDQRNADTFRLLGAVLIAKKDYLYATLSLNQALLMDPDNGDVKVNLARCYEKFGFDKMKMGMAWSSLLAEKQSEWSTKKALEIINGDNK